MGPFQFFHTIMPCNHGLLAMRGKAKVKVSSDLIQGSYEAQLYVEKDWGDTFPDRYIWIHADFPKENVALFFFCGHSHSGQIKIPWIYCQHINRRRTLHFCHLEPRPAESNWKPNGYSN